MPRPEPLTLDAARFAELARAYGADLGRWPPALRDAAAARLAAQDPSGAAADAPAQVLAEAAELDFALDAWRLAPPSQALVEAVLAAAPRRPAWAGRPWIWRTGVGAGLAAACAAGVLTGATLAQPQGLGDDAAALAQAFATYELAPEAEAADGLPVTDGA